MFFGRNDPEVRREGREPLPDHAGESPLLSRSGGAEAAVLNSRAGFSNPIVSFRFAWACPLSEPEIRAGWYRGLGLAA